MADNPDLWRHFSVSLTVERLTGGIPSNPKLMQAWLEANGAPAEAVADQEAMLARLAPEDTHAVVFYRYQPNAAGGQAHGDLRCSRV